MNRRRAHAPRAVNLAARFTPKGPDDTEAVTFMEYWLAAMEQAHRQQQRKFREKKRRQAAFLAALQRTTPVFLKMLRNELPVEEAVKRLKRLVPDRQMLREVFDFCKQADNPNSEQRARERAESARRGGELAGQEKRLKARRAILTGYTILLEAAQSGDAAAAKELVEAAIHVTGFVQILEAKQPEILAAVARRHNLWPLLAEDEPGWERAAAQRVARLQLGTEDSVFQTRFRTARGTEANLPARRWAKAAVRTIDLTRLQYALEWQLAQDFGATEALVDFCLAHGWLLADRSHWAKDAMKLKPFSTASLPDWKRVVRRMIREQMPDFHTHPDWPTQRNTAALRGRTTPGELQNAILDDICSALQRIAPVGNLPKSAC